MIEDEYIIKRQPMYSGQADAAARQYFRYTGRSGRTWLVADQPNAADHIFVSDVYPPGYRGFKGFGGSKLVFKIVGQDEVTLIGPWHTNSHAFFEDTGIDIMDKSLTFVVVARHREAVKDSWDTRLSGILYIDPEGGLIGQFERGERIAEVYADKMGEEVVLHSDSLGGSFTGKVKPMEGAGPLERVANRLRVRESRHAHTVGDASPEQAAIIGS